MTYMDGTYIHVCACVEEDANLQAVDSQALDASNVPQAVRRHSVAATFVILVYGTVVPAILACMQSQGLLAIIIPRRQDVRCMWHAQR